MTHKQVKKTIEQKINQTVAAVKKISDTNNLVFLVALDNGQKLIFKYFTHKSPFQDNQAYVYKKIKNHKYFKKIIYYDDNLIITNYIEGQTVLRLKNRNKLPRLLAKQISDLIKLYHAYQMSPMDLNLKNLLITENNRLIFLDPAAIVNSNKIHALGEWMAHTYGTHLWDDVLRYFKLSKSDLLIVHQTAMAISQNILDFIKKNKTDNWKTAKPFGNNKKFIDLIKCHQDYIGRSG